MPISDDDKLIEAGRVLGQELLGTLLGTIDTAKEQLDKAGYTSKGKRRAEKAASEDEDDTEFEEKETDEDDDEDDTADTEDDEDSEIDAEFEAKMGKYTKKMREEMKALFEAAHEQAHKATTKEFAQLMAANNKVLVTAFAEAMNGMRKRTEKAARDKTLADLRDIVGELTEGGSSKARVKSRKSEDDEVESTEKSVGGDDKALPLDDFFSFVGAGAPEAKIGK